MGLASEFSRPSRAGLIEALASERGPCPACPGFPALHGRASLKRQVRPRQDLAVQCFPALHGRASLKHDALHVRDVDLVDVFPPFTGGPH